MARGARAPIAAESAPPLPLPRSLPPEPVGERARVTVVVEAAHPPLPLPPSRSDERSLGASGAPSPPPQSLQIWPRRELGRRQRRRRCPLLSPSLPPSRSGGGGSSCASSSGGGFDERRLRGGGAVLAAAPTRRSGWRRWLRGRAARRGILFFFMEYIFTGRWLHRLQRCRGCLRK